MEPTNTDAGVQNPTVTEPTVQTGVVSDIATRLEQEVITENTPETNAPVANTPMLIDLANMSHEQLSQLKSMLSITPDRVQQKRGNIRVTIRSIEKDEKERFIVDFKRSRMALDYDAETGKEMEGHRIPVLLDGETEYVDMNYTEFMQLKRVSVEVLAERVVPEIVEEGQVVQRETGKVVMKEVTVQNYFYTVMLPNGNKVELQGKMVNG